MKKPIIFLLTTFSREYGSYLVTTDSVLLPERLPPACPISVRRRRTPSALRRDSPENVVHMLMLHVKMRHDSYKLTLAYYHTAFRLTTTSSNKYCIHAHLYTFLAVIF